MSEAEQRGLPYLFKLRQSGLVKKLILQQHCRPGWEALATELKLSRWKTSRRVVLVRRKLSGSIVVAPDTQQALPIQLSLIEPVENLAAYEYSVLVTSLTDEVVSLVQHYRDCADCENNFDEIKNQCTLKGIKGWGGFVTNKIKPCRLIARMIALIYNGWSLFVRLAEPDKHYEAIVSRPLLLHGVGKQTTHAAKRHSPLPAAPTVEPPLCAPLTNAFVSFLMS